MSCFICEVAVNTEFFLKKYRYERVCYDMSVVFTFVYTYAISENGIVLLFFQEVHHGYINVSFFLIYILNLYPLTILNSLINFNSCLV